MGGFTFKKIYTYSLDILQIRSALRAIDSLKTISGSETCQPFVKLLAQIRYDEDLAEKFRATQKENKM